MKAAPIIETYRRVWDILSRHERKQAVLLVFLILIMGFTQMAGVASVMPFVTLGADPDAVSTNPYLAWGYRAFGFSNVQQYLLFLGTLLFIALVVSIAVKAVTTYALTRFIEMRSYTLSRKLMSGYLRQPYEWFLKQNSADLGSKILSESERVIRGTLSPALYLITEGVVIVTLVGLLVSVDPLVVGATALAFAGSYAVIYMALRQYLGRIGAERLSANQRRFATIQEAFGSVKDVKVSGLEGALLNRFDHPARRFALTQSAEVVANQMPRFAIEALAFGGLLIVVLFLLNDPGGLQRALPLLALYAFAAYRLMPSLQNFYTNLVALRFAGPALEALNHDLVSLIPEGSDNVGLPEQRPSPLSLHSGIELECVAYTYPGGGQPSIRNVNLRIQANTTVGFVGETGSGKTTIADTIIGLLQPERGIVCVDGLPITAETVPAWQANIGYVPQQIYLTDASISANIAFGVSAEEIDHDAIERVARIANIHYFVSEKLPLGYETVVGERGVRLSGGQRQRIGIARALYHDPDLLVFDEATSALDNLTERAVIEAVQNLQRRKTIIIIAHRLSTVRNCDAIVVVSKGEVVAQGKFGELEHHEEIFRNLVTAGVA